MGIIIRQSIKGTIVNYVGAFIGFLTTTFIVTKYLTEGGEYGLIKIITDTGLLLAGLGQLGTSASIIKFFPYFRNEKNKHNGFFFYLLLLPLIGFVLVSATILIFQVPIKDYFSTNAQEFVRYFYWLFPLAFFMIYQGIFETYSSVLLRIVVPKFVREVLVRVLILICFLLYGFGFIDVDWLVGINVFIYAIAALTNLFYVAYLGHISLVPNISYIRKPLRKSIRNFTIYMIIATLGSGIVSKIDMIMVTGMQGLVSTGIYAIAFYMAAIVEMPARSLVNVATPVAAEHFKKKEIPQIDQLYKKVALNQFIAGGLVFLLIWINIDNLFEIIPKGENLKAGKWVVFFMGIANLINATCTFGSSLLSISKYYYYTLLFTFFLSALTILSNYLLIDLYGISGAAIATMLSLFIYNACMLFLIKKKINIQPFSIAMLKIVGMLLLLFLANYYWITFSNPYMDGIVRSVLFGGMFLGTVYFWKISPDMNNTFNLLLKRLYSRLR